MFKENSRKLKALTIVKHRAVTQSARYTQTALKNEKKLFLAAGLSSTWALVQNPSKEKIQSKPNWCLQKVIIGFKPKCCKNVCMFQKLDSSLAKQLASSPYKLF